MMKKAMLCALMVLFTGSLFAQAQKSAEQRAKEKGELIARYIDSKLAEGVAKLTAEQKAEIIAAQLAYEKGRDEIPAKTAAIQKKAADLKTRAGAANAKVASSEEEAAQINAEKEGIINDQQALSKEVEELKALPETIKQQLDEHISKTLSDEQNKAYNEMKAEQDKKKKS
jgi:hypothetical protein